MNASSSGENFWCVGATSENGHLDEVVHGDMNLLWNVNGASKDDQTYIPKSRLKRKDLHK